MLNERYIISLLEPMLDIQRRISEQEFNSVFSDLEKSEQYEIINIMIKNNISLVEIKNDEKRNIVVSKSSANNISVDYHSLMNLTNEQLCKLYQSGNSAALSAIIEKNSKFVYQVAFDCIRKYKQQSLTIDDLVMEGTLALVEATRRYENSHEAKFVTYAWYWIKQKIIRSIVDTGFIIRIPVHMYEQIIKVNSIRKKYNVTDFNELLTLINTNTDLNYDAQKLHDILIYCDLYMTTASLNEVIGDAEDSEIIDFIVDDDVSVETAVDMKNLKEDINKSMKSLSKREKNILCMRYGISCDKEYTLEQIGNEFGLTRERIRQIEAKALRKMRHPSRSKYLKCYVS